MTPSWWTAERSLLGLGNPVLREDVRVDGLLVQRAGTQRAPGRFLVDEHGSLAVRARALSHRGRLNDLVRHRCRARGERSHPASADILPTLNQACPDGGALHGSRFSERVQVERRPPSGGGERPTPARRSEALPVWGGPRFGRRFGWIRSGSFLARLALAAGDVRVDGLVLPAVLPFVVTRELRLARRVGARPTGRVLLVRLRKLSHGSAPVPLLCHVAHILSPDPFGLVGSGPSARSSNDHGPWFIPDPGRGRVQRFLRRRERRTEGRVCPGRRACPHADPASRRAAGTELAR